MSTYTVTVRNLKAAYNGVFEVNSIGHAVDKVNNSIDTNCSVIDAGDGLKIYGVAHYFDRFSDGSCAIQKGSK